MRLKTSTLGIGILFEVPSLKLPSALTATDAGLIFLDSIDFYINFILLLLGFFETFGAGWVSVGVRRL